MEGWIERISNRILKDLKNGAISSRKRRASRSFISVHKRTISRAIWQIGKANRDSKIPRFTRSDLCISLETPNDSPRYACLSLLSRPFFRTKRRGRGGTDLLLLLLLLLSGWDRRRAAGKSDAASSRRRVYKRDESAKRITVKGAPATLRVETFNLRVRQSIVTGD